MKKKAEREERKREREKERRLPKVLKYKVNAVVREVDLSYTQTKTNKMSKKREVKRILQVRHVAPKKWMMCARSHDFQKAELVRTE